MARAVDIVVPVYNEAASVEAFHARLERLGLADSLIFVDNASTDGTLERLEALPGARIVRHATNLGYGASVRDGILAAESDRVVVIDADLEYPPEAIPELVAALERSAVVYCSRFRGRTPPMPALRRLGNRLVTGLYNRLFRQRATDLYTGMKGLRRDALPIAQLREGGFIHGAELGAMIALAGHAIDEIGVDYAPRRRGRSKMRHAPEAAKLVLYLLGYWLRCVVLGRPLHPEAPGGGAQAEASIRPPPE